MKIVVLCSALFLLGTVSLCAQGLTQIVVVSPHPLSGQGWRSSENSQFLDAGKYKISFQLPPGVWFAVALDYPGPDQTVIPHVTSGSEYLLNIQPKETLGLRLGCRGFYIGDVHGLSADTEVKYILTPL
jgi:hypothetical protein